LARAVRVMLSLCLAGGVLLGLAPRAAALNQRVYSLAELMRDAECIAVGRVAAVDSPRMRAALMIEETLKGQVAYRWLSLKVAPAGWGHPQPMIRRLAPGLPVVFFAARVRQRHVVLGYTEGTWFQITAPEGDGKQPDRMPWALTHIEVFLRRTFQGKTEELDALLREVLAGRREAPPPNPGAGAGMGPEVPRDYRPARPAPPLPDFVMKALAEPRAGGVIPRVAVRPLQADEQQWVVERAQQFKRTPEETAALLAQAGYLRRDAQRALEYERDHGGGGNRAWVRSAEEILELKQRSDRLSWLDVRGVLMRAGELFTPVTDPVDLIHGLRVRFTWDELDPMFDDDKWGRRKLNEEVARRQAARSPHPLGPSERLKPPFYNLDLGAAHQGEAAPESVGWKSLPGNGSVPRRQYAWDGAPSGAQQPGSVRVSSPGSARNPLPNRPPLPGIPLAAKAGNYAGAALWFSAGSGDLQGLPRAVESWGHYDAAWLRVRQGDTRTFLFVAQVYTPDHTDDVGEPRGGWFYIRRPSRSIDAGIRVVDAETRTTSLVPNQQALFLKVEPALDRFDRVLLRVDVALSRAEGRPNSEGRNEVKLIAYADGVGEVARATVDLNQARRDGRPALDFSDEGVLVTPAFGLRTAGEGYVPEFYLAALRGQQIGEGPTDVVRPGAPLPRVVVEPAARPANSGARPHARGPRSLVIALDSSSSMAPVFEKARMAALELLDSLKPGERFALLDWHREVHPFAPDWSASTADGIQRAREWLRAVQVKSGTNTAGAVERALAYRGVTQMVLVTDGGPPSAGVTDGGQLSQWVRERGGPALRVDAILVAAAPEDALVARLARDSGGAVSRR